MKTSSLSQLAAFTTLLTCPLWTQAKVDLQQLRSMAPMDSLVYLEVGDTQQASQDWEKGPWGKAWESIDFQSYFQQMGMDEEDQAEGSKVLEEIQNIFSHLKGPAVLALKMDHFAEAFLGEDESAQLEYNGYFAAGHADKKFFASYFEEEGAAKLDSLKVDGFDVYTLENEEAEEAAPAKLYVLLSDDTILLTLNEASAVKYGHAVKGKRTKEAGLVQSPNFQKMLTTRPDEDMYIFANMAGFASVLDQVIDQNSDTIQEAADNGQVVGVDQLKAILGYNTWQSWYMASSFDGEEATAYSAINWDGDGGLLGQIMSYHSGALPQPAWVPADASTLTVASYDMGDLLSGIERLVGRVSPMAGGMYMMMKNQFKMQQLDIEGNLIRNFGSGLVQYLPAEIEESTDMNPVTLLTLRDGPALAQTLTMLSAMQGAPLQFEDYNGSQLLSFSTPQMAFDEEGNPIESPTQMPAPTIAITAENLVYGMSRSSVEGVVDLLGSEASQPLIEEGFIQDYMKSMKPNAAMFAYYDLEKTLNLYLKAMAQMSGNTYEPVEIDGDFITLGQGYPIEGGFVQEYVSKPRK
ncbi:MAG: hypothetical protein Q7P63_01930 [Verrucomicrobiota bacterium JB022]|nr:hypothetical protein [Verrucomicrobiota bacterium JB022]